MRLVKEPPSAVFMVSMAGSRAGSKASTTRPPRMVDCGPARSTIRIRAGPVASGASAGPGLAGIGVEGACQRAKARSSCGVSSARLTSPTTTRVALSGRNQVLCHASASAGVIEVTVASVPEPGRP